MIRGLLLSSMGRLAGTVLIAGLVIAIAVSFISYSKFVRTLQVRADGMAMRLVSGAHPEHLTRTRRYLPPGARIMRGDPLAPSPFADGEKGVRVTIGAKWSPWWHRPGYPIEVSATVYRREGAPTLVR